MDNTEALIKELQLLLPRKKSLEYYALKLGITKDEVVALLDKMRNKSTNKGLSKKASENEISVSGFYTSPPTPEQVIEDHKIDVTKWKLSSLWSKQKSANKYYISANFSPIKEKDVDISVLMENILRSYKSTHIPINPKQVVYNPNFTRPSCALISLTDFHLDKLTIDNISTEKKIDSYRKVLDDLLNRAYSSHLLDEIVFVLGSDFLHSDTIQGTTTKGTPLDVSMSWEEAYEKGFSLMVETIEKLKMFSKKLTIILTPGNHARTKEYYLAHALEVYFKPDKNISFKRESNDLKVYKYGETLLCFSHGSNINDKLPLTFASSFYKEWGQCKYKEVILGDKHHNSEKLFKSQGEAMGIRMRILPSLSGTDRWHQDNLFVGAIQAGIVLIYDKEKGKVAEFESRI